MQVKEATCLLRLQRPWRLRLTAGVLDGMRALGPDCLPREPKPWKFLGFPNSLYRDVIKDPKNFQCLGSLDTLPQPIMESESGLCTYCRPVERGMEFDVGLGRCSMLALHFGFGLAQVYP